MSCDITELRHSQGGHYVHLYMYMYVYIHVHVKCVLNKLQTKVTYVQVSIAISELATKRCSAHVVLQLHTSGLGTGLHQSIHVHIRACTNVYTLPTEHFLPGSQTTDEPVHDLKCARINKTHVHMLCTQCVIIVGDAPTTRATSCLVMVEEAGLTSSSLSLVGSEGRREHMQETCS